MARATDLKKTTHHTDAKVEDVTMFRLRVRCVSGGVPAMVPGVERAERVHHSDGSVIITLSTLEEYMLCVETWNCPVTVAPREGALPWIVELEDGKHDDGDYLYDEEEEGDTIQ